MSSKGGRPRIRISLRELSTLKSEKTIVLALLIQLVIAAFSSFLVVGLVSLYDPASAGGEVSVGVSGEHRHDLASVASDQENVETVTFDDPEGAQSAYQAGAIDAVLVAEGSGDGRIQVETTVPPDGIESTVVVTSLQDVLLQYEAFERNQRGAYLDNQPLTGPDNPDPAPYYGFTYTVLVPLLLLLPVFISGSLAVDTISEELERGTFELLAVAPIEMGEIIDGKLLTAALLAPAQAALWLVLLRVNGTPIENVPALLTIVGALALAVVSMGIGLALVTTDRRQAQFLYSFGILAIAMVTALLPEHPLNTIAKLAIGSPAISTWIAVAGYALLGVLCLFVLQLAVSRLDVERIVSSD
ncbi:ABC transporter permease [Natranaeroarchaeum sulfidigenes]|uniref:ABC-type Na+ efflux pump, permease component n=1 Tax=Natranaeroarchaeum sulfidigenes TaxID=2784880 RepID=A0A897MUH1_9EURY|nr:ABC transporter permease [Natranaeroarchaeum sulfidigenes]QSG02599.1 ABC-type Na+ efflux pump, permease component [Natranaeroarchaeum sulfidigenes]